MTIEYIFKVHESYVCPVCQGLYVNHPARVGEAGEKNSKGDLVEGKKVRGCKL